MNEDIFETTPLVKKSKLNVLPKNPDLQKEDAVCSNGRFPSWLHRKLHKGSQLSLTSRILSENRLHTVCEEAKCPNLFECWSQKTATFLAMGKSCTRNCGFCDIDFTRMPKDLDQNEPSRIALSAKELGLKHVVITMVARDDLEDGGALHLCNIIDEVKKMCPESKIEVLTSDFEGNIKALNMVLQKNPHVFNHNIETVRSLTPRVRHKATYDRTLTVLKYARDHNPSIKIKSGLMVGLGETEDEVLQTLKDLKEAGCHIVTIGQYLQASRKKLLVKSFIEPKQFKYFEDFGKSIGIEHVFSGPFVRSSYHAGEFENF
jgi:lipoic acid synthetase